LSRLNVDATGAPRVEGSDSRECKEAVMARATPKAARRSAPRAAVAQHHPEAADSAGKGADEAMALDTTQWARDAFNASLLQAQSLFSLLQAMQEGQARALQDVSADIGHALEEIEAAEDAQALSAVPSHLFNAQCQHAMANASSTAGRLFEIEADWLRKTQVQAAERLSALGANGGNGAMASAPAVTYANGTPSNGADDSAQAWQQWTAQWQDGMTEMSRAWTEALRAVQPRA
jgi:hypothetical protein